MVPLMDFKLLHISFYTAELLQEALRASAEE